MKAIALNNMKCGNGSVKKGDIGEVIEEIYARYATHEVTGLEFTTDEYGTYPIKGKIKTNLGDIIPNRKPQYLVKFGKVRIVVQSFDIELKE